MKKIIRLTESDLTRIVKRIIEEKDSYNYRGKFRDQDQWFDDKFTPDYDKDLKSVGFYDDDKDWEGFEGEPEEYENWEDLPNDIPRDWEFYKGNDRAKKFFDLYKEKYGPFQLHKRKKY
jgi:hypothetical protein